jgi:hypothetical protein
MKKELKIEVPNDYSAITLRKYLELYDDLKTYEGDDEACAAAMFWHLCGVDASLLNKIDKGTIDKIKEQLYSFLGNTKYTLHRTVKIGDVEYGFEPNLSEMSYGAYVDISKYDTIAIDRNWPKIMSILYRPVSQKMGALYSIQPYTGELNEEFWLDVGMHVHFGTYFFFLHTSTDLVNATLNSSMLMEEIPANIKSILAKSGELINQSSHLQEVMYSKSIQ